MTDLAHFNMVEQQIRTWNVLSLPLLEAMKELDRTLFVPAEKQALCFFDTAIALDEQSSMLMPRVAGRLVQALDIQKDDHVLLVGAGSGYSVALCAMLANTVVCRDVSQAALDRAAQNCEAAGLDNIGFQKVDRPDCTGNQVKYDGIMIREGCLEVPASCLDSLSEGGRCVAAIGQDYLMELTRFTCRDGAVESESIVEILMLENDALTGSAQVKPGFVF